MARLERKQIYSHFYNNNEEEKCDTTKTGSYQSAGGFDHLKGVVFLMTQNNNKHKVYVFFFTSYLL